MSDTKQILLAFFIPLILAVSLALVGHFLFFPSDCSSTIEINPQEVCFGYLFDDPDPFLAQKEYAAVILGLFVLSLTLPSFITMRAYQSRRNQLKTKSIIE